MKLQVPTKKKKTLIRGEVLIQGLAYKCYQLISKGLFYNLLDKVLWGHVDPEKKLQWVIIVFNTKNPCTHS